PELKIIDVFICKRARSWRTLRRPQLHRNGVGPRLCAARAARGRSPHPRLTISRGACTAPASRLDPAANGGFFRGGRGLFATRGVPRRSIAGNNRILSLPMV